MLNPFRKKKRSFIGIFFKVALTAPLLVAIYFFWKYSDNTGPLSALDLGIKPTVSTWLTDDFDFHLGWHPKSRRKRFVSVEERKKIYLSNWYQPPCDADNGGFDEKIGYVYDTMSIGSTPSIALNNREDQVMMGIIESNYNTNMPFFLHEETLQDCKNKDCQAAHNMIHFCKKHPESGFHPQNESLLPVLIYFGTKTLLELEIEYPFFASYRSLARDAKSIKKSTKKLDCSNRGALRVVKNALRTVSGEDLMSPIIWDVYDMKTAALIVLGADTAWGTKWNKAVWRGKLSGGVKGDTFDEKCKSNKRCQLVRNAGESSYINAGVTQQRTDFTLDKSLHLVKSPMTIEEQLKYRMIIIAEGDGYATNLSWALYSNSVVIMPNPTTTSYLMEEKLEPWIHYIPCKDDFSDIKNKVKWAVQNGEKAKRIAERGTLWIHDLYMSDEAIKDNEEVAKFVFKRYTDFFVRE